MRKVYKLRNPPLNYYDVMQRILLLEQRYEGIRQLTHKIIQQDLFNQIKKR
jgi:hypothetical protein